MAPQKANITNDRYVGTVYLTTIFNNIEVEVLSKVVNMIIYFIRQLRSRAVNRVRDTYILELRQTEICTRTY
jgi:hypothetical protein